MAPRYISDIIDQYKPTRSLRSSSSNLLRVPLSNSKTYGDRAYSVAAPTLWNALPSDIKCCTTLSDFKCKLKTHLFRLSFSLE